MLAKASSLFQHFTQSRRLLRLHTPLGPDVLLAECVRGEEALGENYAFTISALSEDMNIYSSPTDPPESVVVSSGGTGGTGRRNNQIRGRRLASACPGQR
jgi:hypothetical protein